MECIFITPSDNGQAVELPTVKLDLPTQALKNLLHRGNDDEENPA